MTRKELLEGLTEEQIEKARACNSEEELLELAHKEGVKLTDEQLASISGGCGVDLEKETCPSCGGRNFKIEDGPSDIGYNFTCYDCGHKWFRH